MKKPKIKTVLSILLCMAGIWLASSVFGVIEALVLFGFFFILSCLMGIKTI